jgi:DNA ligase (NAD+)
MTQEEAKSRIGLLTSELKRHNHLYYVLNTPAISDYQYDMKMKELEKLEEEYPCYALPNSPTQIVGSDLEQNYNEVLRVED